MNMNCSFCGNQVHKAFGTCLSCRVGYTRRRILVIWVRAKPSVDWEEIPEGCLMMVERYNEEIK